MSYAGHNGGPPLTEADVPNLTYVKFYPADFLNGTVHLSLEQRGAYITTLCVMYDRMSGFPYDEKEGAVLLRVDRRVYRRVRDDLLADGKFYRDGDVIRNKRVEDEIKDYISEYVRRSNAAREREERRRLQRTSGELAPNLSRTSAELVPEVRYKFSELEEKKPTKTTECTPQSDHIPEARSQKPEARIKKEREKEVDQGGLTAVAADAALEPADDGIDPLSAFQAWNDLALRLGLQQARSLTPGRRKALCARIREHGGMPAWARALAMVERSAFLQGSNDRGWRADLDFMLQARSFAKLIDGGYGNGAHAPSPRKSPVMDMISRIARGEIVEPPPNDLKTITTDWRKLP